MENNTNKGCCEKCKFNDTAHCLQHSCSCHKEPVSQKEECICVEDNKLTQAMCPIHGGPAYRHSPKTEDWRERFNQTFINFYDEEEDEVDVRSRLTHFIAKEKQASFEEGKTSTYPANGELLSAREVYLFEKGKVKGAEERGYNINTDKKASFLEALRLVEEGLDTVEAIDSMALGEVRTLISDLKKKV